MPTPSTPIKPLLLVSALSCVFTLAALPQAQAASATQAQSRSYSIVAQPLESAIAQWSASSGIQLFADGALTRGKTSSAVSGQYTASAALQQLLAGTGLGFVMADGNRAYLQQRNDNETALQLGATTIQGQGLGMTSEHTGSYTTGAMQTATKLPISVRETPQSVSVITRQRIEDQGMTTLNDVVRNAPGLTLTQWGAERPRFNSRGFGIENIMFDGLPVAYEEASLSTGALAMYDRVEIVRGAAGLMEGAGLPSGSINLIRKRPTVEPQVMVTGSLGSWDNRRFELDAGSALNGDGTLRGRTVLSYQNKNSFTDDSGNERTLLYGIVEADLNDDTTVSLGLSYSDENNPGADWNGLGTYPDGSFLPISRSDRMSPSWSYWNKESKTVFADIEHRFDNGWKAKGAATYITSDMNMMGTFLANPTVDASGNPSMSLRGGKYDYERNQSSVDGYLTGPFEFAGRTHTLVVGASHRESDWDDRGGPFVTNGNYELVQFNPITWDPGSVAKPVGVDMSLYNRQTEVEQSGVYSTARFSLAEPLTLIVGGRVDWYEQEIKNTSHFKANREVTPYAGLVYDLNDTYSVYASWTRIFQPQNLETASGTLLEPIQGTNYEIGLKGEHLGGRLNTSVALFQIDLENLPDQLQASQCQGGTTLCYESAGEIRSRGVEFEVTGALTENWQMSASYTYNTAERIKDTTYSPIGSFTKGKRYGTNLPANLFKLTTSYRLPGELDQWRVGGAVRSQSQTYTQYGVEQGGYTLYDVFTRYDVTPNLQVNFNLNNVFDKRYYTSISSTTGSNFFGEPRNFLATARYRF
ncbi:second ferric pyoverdine receptor FpvB [Pseudomonas putida]|uniref:Second ferric pyoverdine receptor FpvB n=1 Tax=Pseudomonas putida TaxID=303 RepID=A0AA37VNN2_PSEPU|nr:TonB-dependent receptor [Pseudomonas putida]GLO15654.1 second ferric pyoverdine receptor FpvB [Pseudomonas putida]GLO37186.1 second ferric pyoverdine receptor FpvB [Pseudomonas putida]HDS0964978.1 TonB-dependent siderophore receptor [Pseudomonas putida]HDS0991360.1 TonB-dependent siderophore receptor [Pseudomonas putida]